MHKHNTLWAHYNPEKAREGIRKSAGALKGVAAEPLKRNMREQRRQDRQGRPA